MPVTKKINLEEKIRESENASNAQMDDIFSQISGLGATNTKKESTVEENEKKAEAHSMTVTISESEADNEKPGYVSLVIPSSLKKQWKIFSTAHGISLSDSIKLGMKLMVEMEQQNKIKIDGGFVTYRD